jgi:TorA maturation chaperone TorD
VSDTGGDGATPVAGSLTQFGAAVADDIDMLIALHAAELTAERIGQLHSVGFPHNLGLSMRAGNAREAIELMSGALQELPGPVEQATLDRLAADYAAIYINNSCRASPLESVWLDEDGLAYQQPMFQVRDWYRRYDLAAENWRKRSDDHLVMQLQFVAFLCRRARSREDLGELARFLDEHLLRWVMDFAWRVAARCDTAFYAGLCLLSAVYLEALRDIVATATDQPRPSRQEIEQRMNPAAGTAEAELRFMPGSEPSW